MTDKRPPHRPSRRAAVVDAAMTLFASRPPAEVTVGDIAAEADMTAAAVYYHFPSKEHVLLEGLQDFTRRLLATIDELAVAADGDEWAGDLVVALLAWIDERATAATVYFAHSAGVDASIEALRRQSRTAAVEVLADAIRRRATFTRSSVDPDVAAIGLISLIETAATSWLTRDSVFLDLGRRRFLTELRTLAIRLSGPAVTSAT